MASGPAKRPLERRALLIARTVDGLLRERHRVSDAREAPGEEELGRLGVSLTEILLGLLIVGLVVLLVTSGGFVPRPQPTPLPQERAAYDGEAMARFLVLHRQAQEYLRTHGNLFTWISAQNLDLRPTRNWTYSLRRVSALEIAVYAHGRTQNQGRRWRLSLRSDGSASTHLEVP